MVFEKPEVEFIELSQIDTTSTSGSGVESCKGPTSPGRNCSVLSTTIMDDCGTYIQDELDADWTP